MRPERELTLFELEMHGKKLGLTSFQINQIKYKYQKLLARGLTRGRTIERTFAAITYSLNKKHDWGLKMKTIADRLNYDKYELFRTYKNLKRKTNLLK